MDHVKELVDPTQVTVSSSGCLGSCGAGPNLAFLPEGLIIKSVGTPARAAKLVEKLCAGGESCTINLKALELKTQVNGFPGKVLFVWFLII